LSEEFRLYVRGPLGLWPFPILNALLAFVYTITQAYRAPVSERRPRARTYNIVRDERGRIVSIEEVWIE